MKNNILKICFIAVLATVFSYNIYSSKSDDMLTLTLDNIEALAWEAEIGTICATTCSNCWCYYPPCCGSSSNDYWADGEPYN